jgi:DNA-binding LacI/PurR family transcriptional regulator
MKCDKHIDRLRKAIQGGQLGAGEMVGTESSFMEKWGVARSTVRRGIDALVQEGLLERQPGKGLYVRSADRQAKRTVQVIVPNLAWTSHVKIARGVQLSGNKHGVQTLVFDAHGQMERDLEALRGLPESQADGAVIVSLHNRRFSEVLFDLKAKKFPFVLIGERLRDLDVPTVVEDNYGGGYLIGQKLAALGHQRVAFLAPLDLHVNVERLNGFRDAMLDAFERFDRSLVVDLEGQDLADWLGNKVSTAEEALLPLLTRSDRPTAVFDGSGDVVPYVYRAAQRADLRIPRDLSVVAFDDSPFSQLIEPEVSRLTHASIESGEIALEMLLEQMNRGSQATANECRMLKATWVAGQSLAAPREIGTKHRKIS